MTLVTCGRRALNLGVLLASLTLGCLGVASAGPLVYQLQNVRTATSGSDLQLYGDFIIPAPAVAGNVSIDIELTAGGAAWYSDFGVHHDLGILSVAAVRSYFPFTSYGLLDVHAPTASEVAAYTSTTLHLGDQYWQPGQDTITISFQIIVDRYANGNPSSFLFISDLDLVVSQLEPTLASSESLALDMPTASSAGAGNIVAYSLYNAPGGSPIPSDLLSQLPSYVAPLLQVGEVPEPNSFLLAFIGVIAVGQRLMRRVGRT